MVKKTNKIRNNKNGKNIDYERDSFALLHYAQNEGDAETSSARQLNIVILRLVRDVTLNLFQGLNERVCYSERIEESLEI